MIPKTNQNKIFSIFTFLFLILLFVRPFISEMAYPMLGGYIRIAILVIFFICLSTGKKIQISANPFNKPLLLYVVAIIISLFYSINLHSSLYQIYQLIPLLCLFFFASNLEDKQCIKLTKIILISASILTIYGIYQYLWGFEHTKEYLSLHLKDMLYTSYAREILMGKRAIATFFSPNMFASYLIMAIPLCAGLLMDNITNKKPYLFYLFSLVIMLIVLFLTKSLAGWISLSFGVILFFIFSHRLPSRIALIFAIFILIMPLFILLSRYDMFINFANQQNTVLQRLSFWRSTSEIIKDFPLGGVGLGNLGNIYPMYRELIANETRFAHNLFLQTWAEIGLLGVISILLLISTFIRASLKIKRNFITIGLIISCYIFIINNLFNFSYFIPQVSFLWWINLGLIAQKIKPPNSKLDKKIKSVVVLIILLAIYLNIKSIIALNHFQKAEYKKAIAIEPYNDLYYAAIKDYNKAIKLNPYSPFYHKELALLYLNNDMIKEAIFEFEKASNLYPANESLHQRLFDLYKKVGETDKAETELKKLKKIHSKSSGYFMR